MFFTNWTLLVTCIYLAIAIAASKYQTYGLLAWHHIMFEVSLIMNIVVVSIYWSILHEESVLDCGGDPLKIINVYWAHIIPCFSVATNFGLTDVVMLSLIHI